MKMLWCNGPLVRKKYEKAVPFLFRRRLFHRGIPDLLHVGGSNGHVHKQRCANPMVVYAEDFLHFGVNEKGGAPLFNVSSFTHGFQVFKRLHCFSRASFSV